MRSERKQTRAKVKISKNISFNTEAFRIALLSVILQ